MAEYIAVLDVHGELGGEEPVLAVGIEIILRWLPRAAAIEAEWAMVAPVGAHLQHAFVLEETVIAPEWHAAAIFSGAGLVRHELVGGQLDRMLRLGHLDR